MGGGIKRFDQSEDKTANLLPKSCNWIQDKAVEFDPENNTVKTSKGEKVRMNSLTHLLSV